MSSGTRMVNRSSAPKMMPWLNCPPSVPCVTTLLWTSMRSEHCLLLKRQVGFMLDLSQKCAVYKTLQKIWGYFGYGRDIMWFRQTPVAISRGSTTNLHSNLQHNHKELCRVLYNGALAKATMLILSQVTLKLYTIMSCIIIISIQQCNHMSDIVQHSGVGTCMWLLACEPHCISF